MVQRFLCGCKTLCCGPANVGVAQDRVARDTAVSVDQRSAVYKERARFAFVGRCLQPTQTCRQISVLEQEQAESRLGVDMSFGGGSAQPGRGCRNVGWNASAEPIGLAQIERGIRIAVLGEWPPDRHSLGIIALLPSFYASLHGLGRD